MAGIMLLGRNHALAPDVEVNVRHDEFPVDRRAAWMGFIISWNRPPTHSEFGCGQFRQPVRLTHGCAINVRRSGGERQMRRWKLWLVLGILLAAGLTIA